MAKARGPTASLEFGLWILYLLSMLVSEAHSVRAQPKLDMAPDAVDDSYKNCESKTLDYVTKTGGQLKKELKASGDFTKIWNMGKQICKKQLPGGTDSHMIALHAYANSKSEFRKDFNSLVYSKGINVTTYMHEFPLKSLHFLLMDAMRLANPQQRCTTVYYATKTKYTADSGKEVRFGKFISAKKTISEALEIPEEEFILFNISSCSAVNFEDFTCTAEEVSFLISPNEVFTVGSSEKIDNDDDKSYMNIMLNHSRFLSNRNCVLVSSSAVGLFLSSAPVLRYVLLALVCLHVVLI